MLLRKSPVYNDAELSDFQLNEAKSHKLAQQKCLLDSE